MTKKRVIEVTTPNGYQPKEWKPFMRNNCYFYAINCMVPVKNMDVGELSGVTPKSKYSDEELLQRIYADMAYLNVRIRPSDNAEEMQQGEWKIAIFNADEDSEIYDFHFMREDSHNRWSHKFENQLPSKRDFNGMTIMDPEYATISLENRTYHLVGFYALKKENS